MCFQIHANLFELYLEFLWSKNYKILWVCWSCLVEALAKISELVHVQFLNYRFFLLSLINTCVNFHNFSMDLVKVKFGECYSYARMMLGKIRNILLDTFQQGFLIMLKNRHATCYFGYCEFCLLNGFEIFMVVYVKHEIATIIFCRFL